ncbi:flagellar hook-associated protein FlgK [Geosporobacter ferrireducens]|uniref:Flagellar hook-associated protein 1 n=1 Tax=Geosporobacter ferrireducens TaxID=1424294 RepID=A0A1D8GGJ0_9FIRM|nr:flagellar hook-associated protein FlgK [Geosporobacter ferrireducens]AOT70029.1 flagellar hook-associated protein FlgK [Geosporobacter ferrireducens]MTI53425.1 flagellar hook-associated protein FlgK [Geosporobacter ferrireducens]
MSTFFGLNISRSGLFSSQRALNVVGHNIANTNTPGYTRQRLEVQASRPMTLPNGRGMLGTGVDDIHIRNIRDEFLDMKFRSEHHSYGKWNVRADVLANIEVLMNEPTDAGIRTVMDQFFASFQDLNNEPESLTVRALVRERAIAFTTTINHMSSQLEKMQKDLDFSVKTTVDEINGYARQIADLNQQIFSYEVDGSKANDLRDQRNLLLDKLSELVNIDAFEDHQGRMTVLVTGKALVSHNRCSELTTQMRKDKLNSVDVPGLCDVVWKDGSTFNPQGGKLKGLLDSRDHVSGDTKGIPYYMEQLNTFAKTFAAQVNAVHRQGYGLDGSTGIDFFEMGGGEFVDVSAQIASKMTGPPPMTEREAILALEKENGTTLGASYTQISVVKMDGKYYATPQVTASTLKISAALEGDAGLNLIAASSTYAGLPGNGQNALNINLLKDMADMFDWGKPEDFIKSLISNLGVDSQQAQRFADGQAVLLYQIESQRMSISGVSLDEEMADMIRFQHAYNANARMITTIDEMIDVIVNRMGLVGR